MISDECRVCLSHGPHAVFRAREMMYGLRHPFDYFECAGCGCLQIREFPTDISAYYPKDYYALTGSPEGPFSHPVQGMLLRARVRYAVFRRGLLGRIVFHKKPEWGAFSLRSLNPTVDTSVLDVGCGNGGRLYALRAIGFRNLLGVDPHLEADLAYGNGLKIEKKSLADVDGQWDVVMFHHSFEHIGNPLETLKEVRRVLKPSGQCVIRIPVADSFAWKHYRTDWVQLDAPRHLFLHTRASMDHLAEAAGLRVAARRCDATDFQFLGSELYRRDVALNDSASKPKIFTRSEIRAFQARTAKLNAAGDGDSAAFYLTHEISG